MLTDDNIKLILQIIGLVWPIAIGGISWWLSQNSKRIDVLDDEVKSVKELHQQGMLKISEQRTAMAELRSYVLENFADKGDIQNSLSRVHEKIEEGNRKTDQINENVGNKIDQLRRDMQADIRASLASIRASWHSE